MPAPSQLEIATAALSRLVREEETYHDELAAQERRVQKLNESKRSTSSESSDNDNRQFMLNQETQALAETRAVFGPLHERMETAASKLQNLLDAAEAKGKDTDTDNPYSEVEIRRAHDVLVLAKK